MSTDLDKYLLYHADKYDVCEADGSVLDWETIGIDLPERDLRELENLAHEKGVDLETLLISIVHREADRYLGSR